MSSLVISSLLVAILLLLVLILIRQIRSGRDTVADASLRRLVDSFKDLSTVQSQVSSIAVGQQALAQSVNQLEVTLKELETKLAQTTGDVKTTLSRDVSEARRVLAELKARFEDQTRLDTEIHTIARRIERVLVGARTRGASGENILADAFNEFPPEMIDRDYRIGGRVVEYAMILPNKKRLPIDSKWSSMETIERIARETDPERIKRLEAEVEKEMERKVREVASYIDLASTSNIAIAAVPDAVYALCKRVHVEAFKKGVLIMAYSMVIPYVLALYHLHLQMAQSIDFENLEAYLTKIERSLDEMDRILENRIARVGTMASNAYTECKQILGSIRAATAYLRELPAKDTQKDEPLALGGSQDGGET